MLQAEVKQDCSLGKGWWERDQMKIIREAEKSWSKSKLKFRDFFFYVYLCFACIYTCVRCWMTQLWVLGIELLYSGRVSALNH